MQYKIKSHLHSHNKKYYEWATPSTGDRIQYKEVFHVDHLLQHMHDWLVENGWTKSAGDPDFPEVFYHHQFKQGGIEDVRWWWRLSQYSPQMKGSKFYKYEMNVDCRIIALVRTEVMQQGMKFKTMKGDIEVNVGAKLVLDENQEFRNHWLLKHFWDLWLKRIKKNEIADETEELKKEVDKFKDHVKAYFKIPIFNPEPQGERGWGNTKDFDS